MRDKDNELVVIKANEMIQHYKYTLSKTEIRIVNTIISNIQSPKYDQELNVMEFDILEFCRMLGLENTGGENYKILRKTLWSLSNKSSDYIDFGNYETIVRWIERPIFEKGTGIVKLKLDDYLKPFLLQASGTINAKLKYYFEMDSKYSMRLYELLKSYDGYSFAKFDIDDLKIHIDALKKSYSNYAMFKRTVLDPAVEEINKFTDLTISYTTRTRGRKITHVDFSIKKKTRSDLMKKDVLPVQEAESTEQKVVNEIAESEQIPGQMGIDDFLSTSEPGVKRPATPKEAVIMKLKDARIFENTDITDDQAYEFYLQVRDYLKQYPGVLEVRTPEAAAELIRHQLNLLVRRTVAFGPERVGAYLEKVIKNEPWDEVAENILAKDKAAAYQAAAQASEERDEAARDEEVELWKKQGYESVEGFNEAIRTKLGIR